MSEIGGHGSQEEKAAAELFTNKNLVPEKQGFAKSLTKGTMKGLVEAGATIAIATVSEQPTSAPDIFDEERAKYVPQPEEKKEESSQREEEGTQGSEQQDSPEKQQSKAEQKTARSGRERSQPPASEKPAAQTEHA